MKLPALLMELKEKLSMIDRRNESVSQAPVGWHIQHSLMVINTIVDTMQKSDPINYKWKFNFLRSFILTVGKFPRGRVQSPKSVRPKEQYNLVQLEEYFIITENNVRALDDFSANSFFTHPIFGDLNVKPAITFLKLHTKHHLKIINDILK